MPLRFEMLVVKNCLLNTKSDFDLEDLKLIVDIKIYNNLYKLLSVFLSIPISSSTCERSFSAMRNIKNWLQTSMSHERFSNSSLIYIKKRYFL